MKKMFVLFAAMFTMVSSAAHADTLRSAWKEFRKDKRKIDRLVRELHRKQACFAAKNHHKTCRALGTKLKSFVRKQRLASKKGTILTCPRDMAPGGKCANPGNRSRHCHGCRAFLVGGIFTGGALFLTAKKAALAAASKALIAKSIAQKVFVSCLVARAIDKRCKKSKKKVKKRSLRGVIRQISRKKR